MKPANPDSPWHAAPPSPPQASRIVATVSIAGAFVFGLIVLQPLWSGSRLGLTGSLFAAAAIHLLLQAGTSALSWQSGARFAKISLALIAIGAFPFIIQLDYKMPAVFAVSAIVSIAAVKIQLDQAKLASGD